MNKQEEEEKNKLILPDSIVARSKVVRDQTALEHIFEFILGSTCFENQNDLLKQIRVLCIVSKSFLSVAEKKWHLLSLRIYTDLSLCGYGNYQYIDEFYDLYTIPMLRVFTKYGGKYLIDISLSVRVLEDDMLLVIARDCKFLKRFGLSYTVQNCPRHLIMNGVPGHVCFSSGALVEFFNKVNLLSHVHFYTKNNEDEANIKVECPDVINALSRHPLVSLSVNTYSQTSWMTVINMLAKKFTVPDGKRIECLEFKFKENEEDSIANLMNSFSELVAQNSFAFKNLYCLTLINCADLSDESMKLIWPAVPNLKSLSISPGYPRISQITNSTLQLIAKFCPKLTYLDIRNQININASGISLVLEKCENLLYLDLINIDIDLNMILEINPTKVVSLQCLRYGNFTYAGYGNDELVIERNKIIRFIEAYPQILFVRTLIGLVNSRNTSNPLTKLSLEFLENNDEFGPGGFKRVVSVYKLYPDEVVSNFRHRQKEIIIQTASKRKRVFRFVKLCINKFRKRRMVCAAIRVQARPG